MILYNVILENGMCKTTIEVAHPLEEGHYINVVDEVMKIVKVEHNYVWVKRI